MAAAAVSVMVRMLIPWLKLTLKSPSRSSDILARHCSSSCPKKSLSSSTMFRWVSGLQMS